MGKLCLSDPEVYQHFINGQHIARRSDRYWAGLPLDLIIEQVLMRLVKTTVALTRGRGMSEIQRLIWLLSRPACTEVNLAMQDLLGISYQTSEQHKDISESRQEKDQADSTVLVSFLSERKLFKDDHNLHNIVTGVVSEHAVNAPDAKDVGNNIISSLHGKKIMRRKEQVVTMASQNVIKIRDEMIPLDPQLLFQRLVTAGMRQERMGEVFTYKLCSYPPSMFENRHSLLPADKPALAEALWKLMPMEKPLPVGDTNFVLDGGALLHRDPWLRISTFEEIC